LWAYAAEQINIDNYLYFYATYTEPRFNVENLQLSGEWMLATWNNYIVTDPYLKSELISIIPNRNHRFFLYGVPWWIDSNKVLAPKVNTKIVVFDKFPHDSLYLFSLLASKGGDTFWYQQKFINDILEVCINLNVSIFYKSKRSSTSKIYEELLEELSIKYNSKFIIVDEKIAPVRLIEEADLVISRAASSTALIASKAGVDSVIYDPAAILNPKDPSIRGGLLVQSKSKLQEVVNQLFST
jgi:polysaccharide biosynthesis PFTS motif protein